MKCPHCHRQINIGAMLGRRKSKAKSEAARANGKLGGRPKKQINNLPHGAEVIP